MLTGGQGVMDLPAIIRQLYIEKERLARLIAALEALARSAEGAHATASG